MGFNSGFKGLNISGLILSEMYKFIYIYKTCNTNNLRFISLDKCICWSVID